MHAVTMPERKHFKDIQYAFAAHIRDPQKAEAPGDVAPQRMAVYGELFFANVREQLATAFPVLHAIMPASDWESLCHDFFAHHHCASPLFHELPREFLLWLEQEREPQPNDSPWLFELAHYEWVELALSLAGDELPEPQTLPQDLLSWVPRLSPLAWPLSYRFAVHRIGPGYQPEQTDAVATHLLVYRDRRDKIGFMELNPVSARLLQLIAADEGHNSAVLLRQIAEELQHTDTAALPQGGGELLQQLHQRDIVL